MGFMHAISYSEARENLKSVIDRFARNFPWRTKKNARADAIRMLASMYGGVVLARAVDDEALSEEILREVLAGLQAAPKP